MRPTSTILLMTSLSVLAACSSGGGSGADTADQPGLFFGSTESDVAANGQPFAKPGDPVSVLATKDVKIRLLQDASRDAAGGDGVTLTNEVINLSTPTNFTVTIDGQEISFVDGQAIGPNGEVYRGQLTFDGVTGRISAFEDVEGTVGETYRAVFGLETNPATIDALTGQVTYVTDLNASGVVSPAQNNLTAASLFGSLSLTADFGTGIVNGQGDGSIVVSDGSTDITPAFGVAELDFAVAPGAIQGNGFVADLNVTSCGNGANCSSNSQIGGVFFGADAQEVAGLATLDITVTDANGDAFTFEGGGDFGDFDTLLEE